MKVELSDKPERPRKVIERSFKLYRHVFLHVFYLALLLAITAFIPRLLIVTVGENIYADLGFFSPYKIWILFVDLLCLIFFTAMLWRIRCVITDTHESMGDDMRIAIRKLPYIFVAALVQTLFLVAIGLFFVGLILLVPHKFDTATGIYIVVASLLEFYLIVFVFYLLYFYLPIILVENEGVIHSLTKSAHLVWGNWWRVFIVQITPWFAYFIALIIVELIFGININIFFINPEIPPTFLSIILHILVFAIFIPWVGCVLLLQLRDLELRKNLSKPTIIPG